MRRPIPNYASFFIILLLIGDTIFLVSVTAQLRRNRKFVRITPSLVQDEDIYREENLQRESTRKQYRPWNQVHFTGLRDDTITNTGTFHWSEALIRVDERLNQDLLGSFMSLELSMKQTQSPSSDPVTSPVAPLPPSNPMPRSVVVTCPRKGQFLDDLAITARDETSNQIPELLLDDTQRFQTIEGFGYTLTGGSAEHLMRMDADDRMALLVELFQEQKISVLRLSIGASDLDPDPYSYDDLPSGVTNDTSLEYFTMERDYEYKIPVLKEIFSINPDIYLLATPWSAPSWMKDNNNTVGGTLLPQFYETYAEYLIRYLQIMKAEGFTIRSLTIQNEPLNEFNNPSMYMSAKDQAAFVRDALAPAFDLNDISTNLLILDHNPDEEGLEYVQNILNDPEVRDLVDGSAFHLYEGSIKNLSLIHNDHPDKSIHFTEQWVSSDGNFEADLMWHAQNVLIGGLRNWAVTVLEWNLSSNSQLTPRTIGGCEKCLGAVTIDQSSVTSRNVAYYVLAHASSYISSGSQRIQSSWKDSVPDGIEEVAFQNTDGSRIVLMVNTSEEDNALQMGDGQILLPGRSFATIVY